MPTISVMDILKENEQLRKEVAFLRERNKDLRQKTWIKVYDENLKLTHENNYLKGMITFVQKVFKDYSI